MKDQSKKLVLLLGATGQTGYHIAQKLINQGYPLRVFVRSKQKLLSLFKQRQISFEQIVQGKITNNILLARAFRSSQHYGLVQIVISALGTTGSSKQSVEEIELTAQKNIVDLCKANRVQKYIVITAAMMTRPWHPIPVMLNTIRKDLMFWKLSAQNYIRQSGIKYAIIRPPRLIGDQGCEKVTGYDIDQGDKIGGQITRPTLAVLTYHCMIAEGIPEKVTFECVENTKHQPQPHSAFQSLKPDTQQSIIQPGPHKTAKTVYHLVFILLFVGIMGLAASFILGDKQL